MIQALLIIFTHSLLAILLGYGYFHCYAIKRPPIGVFNLWDVTVMMGGIVLIPYLYLALPTWLVAGLLGLAGLSAVYFCLEPMVAKRRLIWLLILPLGIGNITAQQCCGAHSPIFFAINNGIAVVVVIGVTNLWAQSGLKARDAAILGGTLMVYDVVFTLLLPLMDNLLIQLEGVPFAPLIAWPLDSGQRAAIGSGDVLLATLFPLVMHKGYGRRAGLTALGLALTAIGGVMLVTASGLWPVTFPVMVVLGPLMVGQYGFWRRRQGVERTMFQCWQEGSCFTLFTEAL